MRRWLMLSLHDWRSLLRDPMLALMLAAPFLLTAFFRWGTPYAGQLLFDWNGFDLTQWYSLILVSILCLVPLLFGTITGFMMLDERDEQLIMLYAVTPLRKTGYLLNKMYMLLILSLIFMVLIIYGTNLSNQLQLFPLIGTLVLLALEAPLIAMFLVAYANTKVEGLALSKVTGIVVFGPAAAALLPWPWQLIGGVLPTFWAAQVFLPEASIPSTGAFIVGFVFHAALLWIMYLAFQRRMD